MPELSFATDLFEMIAAVAALGVTAILYLETRSLRAEMREDRKETQKMLDEMRSAKSASSD